MFQDYNGYEAHDTETGRGRANELIESQPPPSIYVARLEHGRVTNITVGDGICELFGYSRQELETDLRLWTSIIHPDDVGRVLSALGQLVQGDPIFELYRVFRSDGQMRWIRHAAVPGFNNSGEITKLVGMIAEARVPLAMPDSLPRYRILLEEIPMAVMIRDMEGTVIYSNKAAALAHGYETGDEMVGTSFEDIIAPESYEEFVSEVYPAIASGHWSGDIKLRRKDGSSFHVRAAASLLRDEQGNPAAIYGVLFDISEHMRAEEARAESVALLQQFVENMPAAVAMFDREMRYLVVSRRWISDYRLGDQEIIGRSHYEVFPEVPERWKQVHQRVLSGSTEKSEEDSFLRVEGRQEWVRWELRPWRDSAGDIGGLIMYTEVITERKETEQALRESQRLLATVQNSLPAEIAVLDQTGNIIAVNEVWERFARENGDPLLAHTGVGINYLDVCRRSAAVGCEDAVKALNGLTGVLGTLTREFEMEYELPVRGEALWFSLRAAPLVSEQGGLVVSHTDITARKRTEEALRTSEEKYRTLVENVDAIVFRTNAELQPLMIAGKVEKVSGWTSEEMMSDRDLWFEGVVPEDREHVYRSLERIAQTGQPGSFEMRIRRRSGDIRWIRANITPQFDAQGELIYYDGIDMDVTEQMEAVLREERHAARVDALARINQETAGVLEPANIINAVTGRVAQVVECVCAVLTVDPATARLYVASFSGGDLEGASRVRGVVEKLQYFLPQEFGPGVVPSIEDLIPEEMRAEAINRLGSSIIRQLQVEGKPYGFLVGIRPKGAMSFEDDDVWFFSELASYMSAGLTIASLYRRQTRIAETLQRSLIPSIEEVTSLDIATCYLPAVGEAEIGGDFFDMLDFGDNRVGIVVGDVSGKGMDAAIHTAEAKYMLRGYAMQDSEPAHVMSALNKALYRYTSEFTFITLVYLLVDASSHTVTYVNAGHEPPLVLCRNTGEVHEYKPLGPALGIVRDYEYISMNAVLESDDLLICYTDGVTDVPRNGDRFGYDRLVQAVAEAKAEHPQQLMEHVLRRTREYSQGVQPDDQVIVVVTPNI